MERHELATASWVVTAGRPHGAGRPVNHPMAPSSTFEHGPGPAHGDARGRVYAREDATAGWEAFEEVVGGLEGGPAVAFASGMAAVAAVFDRVPSGTTVAIPDDAYQGVAGLASRGAERGRWTVRRIPTTDTTAWVEALEEVSLAWLESPSNPLLQVADVPAIVGADRPDDTVVVVDNTFATPLNQRPLEHGADLVVHSATKFLGGHSDLLAGVVVASPAREDLWRDLRDTRTYTGATPGTLEAFLALRGTRTLALRLAAAQSTARVLAERLDQHPAVGTVRYPGLVSHPDHEVASRVLDGAGAMLSFDLADGPTADAVCDHVRLVRHATSLGGVESLVERRAGLPGQGHLPAGLLRLSVGCEDVEDLWHDLDRALATATGPDGTPA